ncbi:g10437 [Coccomyxa elongata]
MMICILFFINLVQGEVHALAKDRAREAYECDINKGAVLGYVTPWNGRGYNVAKAERGRFTHISPVWYQLRAATGSLTLSGSHDVDEGWIADVRGQPDQGCDMPMIVPRFVLEMHPQQLLEVLTDMKPEAVRLLAKECRKQMFDGLVLEGWSVWHAYGIAQNHFKLIRSFLRGLAKALHKQTGPSGKPMELILAVPPVVPAEGHGQPAFTAAQFEQLAPFVDGFSLMTYDWNIGGSGPNAPFPWVEANVKQLLAACVGHSCQKVWLGINFYGRDFADKVREGEVVLGHDHTRITQQHQTSKDWDEVSREHLTTYQKDGTIHRMYYPTLEVIQARVTLAREHNFGISIWELGQGLDDFTTVL